MMNTSLAMDIGLEFVTNLGEDLTSGKIELPAFPDVALRIREAIEDPDISAEQIARIASSDPILTAKILKLANSAAINASGQKIMDIRMAVTRIGMKLTQSTALSYAVEQSVKAGTSKALRPHLETLWSHSIQVAAYAYVIAKKLARHISQEEAMLAGLLHDIGKFYILSSSEKYPDLLNSPDTLMHIMDDWHTGVGRSIVEAWNFSADFAIATDEHETLNRSHSGRSDLTDVVMIANLLSNNEHTEESEKIDWSDIPASIKLGMDPESLLQIMSESVGEVDSIVNALEF